MQEYQLTNEQARCLQKILQSRADPTVLEQFAVPDELLDVLVDKGLVRRWRDGSVEITLGGMREVARRTHIEDEAHVSEVMGA